MICNACPRKCGVDRSKKHGFCGAGESFVVARAAKHFWEEPPISGTNGSGAVFFPAAIFAVCFARTLKSAAQNAERK